MAWNHRDIARLLRCGRSGNGRRQENHHDAPGSAAAISYGDAGLRERRVGRVLRKGMTGVAEVMK